MSRRACPPPPLPGGRAGQVSASLHWELPLALMFPVWMEGGLVAKLEWGG